jgi:hypothetical protein
MCIFQIQDKCLELIQLCEFWRLVTRILITSFLHKLQTIMYSREIVHLQETLVSISKRVPKIKLERVELTFPGVTEILVSI